MLRSSISNLAMPLSFAHALADSSDLNVLGLEVLFLPLFSRIGLTFLILIVIHQLYYLKINEGEGTRNETVLDLPPITS